jgi:M3 family oligoendopeptidase
MLRQVQEMFDELGGDLGEFFRFMRKHDLLDLRPRTGKAGGGFCTNFIAWGIPFLFANLNGTKEDVEVFTAEMGHAFQAWKSRHLKPIDYCWPTLEACEIHSMSLQFITWPWMDRFFGEEADRCRWLHLADSLLFIPYAAAVDHFQHLVYENPDASPADRFTMWRDMERTYMPWRDYGDLPHVDRGGLWQAQRHIYLWPFYYLDYALASTCALQFWVRAEENREEALAAYTQLCARGGEAPFHQLVRGAGLISPFEEGCVADVIAKARTWLRI